MLHEALACAIFGSTRFASYRIDLYQQIETMDRMHGNALLIMVAADKEHADLGLAVVDKESLEVD